MKDLVVLVSDQNMKYVLKGLLARPQALGIHPKELQETLNKEFVRSDWGERARANALY